MKVSKNTRQARAGKKFAESIIETIHSFYLNDNALQYLQTLIETLNVEFNRRLKEQK